MRGIIPQRQATRQTKSSNQEPRRVSETLFGAAFRDRSYLTVTIQTQNDTAIEELWSEPLSTGPILL
jgi:hypothetical protein